MYLSINMVNVKEGFDLSTSLEMVKVESKPTLDPIQNEEQIQMVKLEKLVQPVNMPVSMVNVD